MLNSLQAAQFASIATDGWNTPSVEGVITITGHFIDADFSLKYVALAIESITDQTEGHAAIISTILEKFLGLRSKLVAILSDPTAVMPATARELRLK